MTGDNGKPQLDWNPGLAIREHIPDRLVAAKLERDSLVAKVLQLNHEIASLETLYQIGNDLDVPMKREEDNAVRHAGDAIRSG